jgi:hypothetical protein
VDEVYVTYSVSINLDRLSRDLSQLSPDDWQSVMAYVKKIRVQEEKGKELLQRTGVVHLDPTFDKTFKWLTSNDNPNIAKTIWESFLFLTSKGLATREVCSIKSLSDELDKGSEQLTKLPKSEFSQLMTDVPAELTLLRESFDIDRKIWEEIDSVLHSSNGKADAIKNLKNCMSFVENTINRALDAWATEQLKQSDILQQQVASLIQKIRNLDSGDEEVDSKLLDLEDSIKQVKINRNAIIGIYRAQFEDLEGLKASLQEVVRGLLDKLFKEKTLKDMRTKWLKEKSIISDLMLEKFRKFEETVYNNNYQRDQNQIFQQISSVQNIQDKLEDLDINMGSEFENLKKAYDVGLVRSILFQHDSNAEALKNDQLNQLKAAISAKIDDAVSETLPSVEDGSTRNFLVHEAQKLKTYINSSMNVSDIALESFTKVIADIEMQRKNDDIEKRSIQYGAVAMLIHRCAEGMLPLILVSICGWSKEGSNGTIIDDIVHGVLDSSKNPMLLFQETIYLQNPPGKLVDPNDNSAKDFRKKIKGIFKNALWKRYPELTRNVWSFKELAIRQAGDSEEVFMEKRRLRTAYELLCFLRLAPLTPGPRPGGSDRDPNVDKVDGSKGLNVEALSRRVFNPEIRKAYELMEMGSIPSEHAQEQYLGAWSQQEEIDRLNREIGELRRI